MAIKLRITYGPIEIEYEGEEEFFRSELPNILDQLSGMPVARTDNGASTDANGEPEPARSASADTNIRLSTTDIAAMMDAKSSRDLATAACAHLTFVKNQDTFSRNAILDDMKSARAYYKKSFSTNLNRTLDNMAKAGELSHQGQNRFALTAAKRKDLEGLIAS
jgi:hypothetical protein